MTQSTRFGRRLPLPSTIEIKHELRLMAAAEDLRLTLSRCSDLDGVGQRDAIAGDLALSHQITPDRARMLVDRFALAATASKP